MTKSASTPRRNYLLSLGILAGMFFIFGAVSWVNSILIPYFRICCELTHFESYFVSFAFYIAYFIMAVPSGILLKKVGFKRGIMYGFMLTALGAFVFVPAALFRQFEIFLLGLFCIGTGLAVLQTAANPYVTILGPIESAAQRMSVMGVFNKTAGIIAPLILASGADDTPGRRSLFDFPYLWLGALAIFCQVGAQVVAIDTIINYAGSMGMDLVESKVFPSFTLTCTMIGFLSGIVLIPRYVTQKQALVVCSTLGLLLSLGVVLCDFGVTLFGHRANASIFLLNALGLPNALIYAGVWPLAIRGLGRFTKMGSSLLIMGLCGNAILPLVYGFVAERCGMRMGYWVLVPCFLYLVFFAVKGYKIVRWPWQRIENNG